MCVVVFRCDFFPSPVGEKEKQSAKEEEREIRVCGSVKEGERWGE